MSGKFSIKNYDTQGAYGPAQSLQANTKTGQAKKQANGLVLFEQGDGKINKAEFKKALIDFYQTTYGKVGASNKEASLFEQQKYQEFTNFVNNLELGNISIDNDADFVALLTQKAKELKEQIQNNNPDSTLGSKAKGTEFTFGI